MQQSPRNNPLSWTVAFAVCFGALTFTFYPAVSVLPPPVSNGARLTRQSLIVSRSSPTSVVTDSNNAPHFVTRQSNGLQQNNKKETTNHPEISENPSVKWSPQNQNARALKKRAIALEMEWKAAIMSYTHPNEKLPLHAIWGTPDEEFHVFEKPQTTERSLSALYAALRLDTNNPRNLPKFVAPVLNVKYHPTAIQFETSAFISVYNLPATWYDSKVLPPSYAPYVKKCNHQRFSLECVLLPSNTALNQWGALHKFVQSHEDAIHTWSWSVVPEWFFWIDTSGDKLFLRYPLHNNAYEDVLIANSRITINRWLETSSHAAGSTPASKPATKECFIPEIRYHSLHFSQLLLQFKSSQGSQEFFDYGLQSLSAPEHTQEMDALKNLMKKKRCIMLFSRKNPLLNHPELISAAYVYRSDSKECGRWQWCYEVVLCGTSGRPCGFATCVIKTWLQLPHAPQWEGHRIVISDLEAQAQPVPPRFLSRFLSSDASKQYAITLETLKRRL